MLKRLKEKLKKRWRDVLRRRIPTTVQRSRLKNDISKHTIGSKEK